MKLLTKLLAAPIRTSITDSRLEALMTGEFQNTASNTTATINRIIPRTDPAETTIAKG